jgi:hypothetical protein
MANISVFWIPVACAIRPAIAGATPPPKISPAPITSPATDATMPIGAASAAIGPARIASAAKLNSAATNSSPNSIVRLPAPVCENR